LHREIIFDTSSEIQLKGSSDRRFDYSVCANRAKQFYPEIRKYYPNLKDGSLVPGYAGVRPKISGPRHSTADFLIQVISSILIFM
jgi:hypothetical protein